MKSYKQIQAEYDSLANEYELTVKLAEIKVKFYKEKLLHIHNPYSKAYSLCLNELRIWSAIVSDNKPIIHHLRHYVPLIHLAQEREEESEKDSCNGNKYSCV